MWLLGCPMNLYQLMMFPAPAAAWLDFLQIEYSVSKLIAMKYYWVNAAWFVFFFLVLFFSVCVFHKITYPSKDVPYMQWQLCVF